MYNKLFYLAIYDIKCLESLTDSFKSMPAFIRIPKGSSNVKYNAIKSIGPFFFFFFQLYLKRPALCAERQVRLSDLASLANKQIQISYHESNLLWSLSSFKSHNVPTENALKFLHDFINVVIEQMRSNITVSTFAVY